MTATSDTKARARFAALLVERRKEQGYATAYAFFHENGGRKRFGITYQQYLRIEKGVRLPSGDALERIFDAFGHRFATREPRLDLLEAYARASLGTQTVFEPLFMAIADGRRPLEPVAPNSTEELLEIASKKISGKTPRATTEQGEVLLSSAAAFWAFNSLSASGADRAPQELAADLGYTLDEMDQALRRLAEREMVEKRKDATYRSLHHPAGLRFPVAEETTVRNRNHWVSGQFQQKMLQTETKGVYSYEIMYVDGPERVALLAEIFSAAVRRAEILAVKPKSTTEPRLASIEYRVHVYAKKS